MSDRYKEQIKSGNIELFEKGNLDFITKLFSNDYIVHAGDKDYKGHEFIKKFIRQIRSAIPDVHVVDIKYLLQEGHILTWQRTLRGTHTSNMMGIPASSQMVEWRDMMVSRFADGKITEEWAVSELAGELLLKLPKTRKDQK